MTTSKTQAKEPATRIKKPAHGKGTGKGARGGSGTGGPRKGENSRWNYDEQRTTATRGPGETRRDGEVPRGVFGKTLRFSELQPRGKGGTSGAWKSAQRGSLGRAGEDSREQTPITHTRETVKKRREDKGGQGTCYRTTRANPRRGGGPD